jgi:hypothetical protein
MASMDGRVKQDDTCTSLPSLIVLLVQKVQKFLWYLYRNVFRSYSIICRPGTLQGLHQGCQNLFNSYWAVQCRPRSTSLSRLNQPEQFCRVLFVWSRFAIVQFKDEIHTPCSPEERILSLFPVFFCSFRVRQLLCMSPLGNIQHDLFQPLNSGNPCILQNRRDRECDRRCRTRARICSHT